MSRVVSRHAVRDSFLGRNGLTLAFLALMLLSILGHALTGWRFDNEERREHGQAAESLAEYVTGEDFLSTLFENWRIPADGAVRARHGVPAPARRV